MIQSHLPYVHVTILMAYVVASCLANDAFINKLNIRKHNNIEHTQLITRILLKSKLDHY